jgi:hypothetical protein
MKDLLYKIPEGPPFVLAFLQDPDPCLYSEPLELARKLRIHYDPISQTSLIPATAGTNATYCGTGTGYLPFPDDDDKRDDY